MIFDRLDHAALYAGLLPRLDKAFAYVKGLGKDAPLGRTELGDGLFATVMEGKTQPAGAGLFEGHLKYIDLQAVLWGQEVVEVAPIEALKVALPYDEARDAAFFQGAHALRAVAGPGDFYLLAPQDGHRACLHVGEPTSYKKVVVKIPVA